MKHRRTQPTAGIESGRLQEASDRVRRQAQRTRQQADDARARGQTARALARELLASIEGAALPEGADPRTRRGSRPRLPPATLTAIVR